MKPSSAANDGPIDRTIEFWQPRLRRELTREDARQIAENVTGFFRLLAEWSKAEAATPPTDIHHRRWITLSVPVAALPRRAEAFGRR